MGYIIIQAQNLMLRRNVDSSQFIQFASTANVPSEYVLHLKRKNSISNWWQSPGALHFWHWENIFTFFIKYKYILMHLLYSIESFFVAVPGYNMVNFYRYSRKLFKCHRTHGLLFKLKRLENPSVNIHDICITTNKRS